MAISEKEMFLQTWEREFQTTLRVLKAYPADKMDIKPADKLRTARDLSFVFVGEQGLVDMVLKGKIDFGGPRPSAPSTMSEIISMFEQVVKANMQRVQGMSDADYNSTMGWMIAPNKPAQLRKADILWITVMDMIHHRGQLSVYFRIAGGKLPSIYGPTADEPWM